MKKILFCICFAFTFVWNGGAQNADLGIFHGRMYAIYKAKDYGKGFKNMPGSQYMPFPSFAFSEELRPSFSMEYRASFMPYTQYTGTRLYAPGFFSTYLGANLSATFNYTFIKTQKFESRMKGGIGLGITPDMYEAEFEEIHVYPYIDSISRGTIKRNYTPLFPTLCMGIDFSYRFARRFKVAFAGVYQKGFLKITQYDIYYNDGSGYNDQRAKQWGTGDFYGVQLGLRYLLKDENGNKFGKKAKK